MSNTIEMRLTESERDIVMKFRYKLFNEFRNKGIEVCVYSNFTGEPQIVINTDAHDNKVKADAINEAIHRLDNAQANCHEDYVDGIDFAIGVLENIAEQIKEQK